MRTALRTAVATALVAGVVLTTPALTAGAAFAADGPVAVKPADQIAEPGTLVRTETLIGGTIAKIYKVSALHHRAELFSGGNPVGRLDADARPVAGNDNGEFFVLFPDGRTLNWDRTYLGGVTAGKYWLADGTLVEVAIKDGLYGLQLVKDGKGQGFTYLDSDRRVYVFGKAVVVLESTGGMSAHIVGGQLQATPRRDGGTPTPSTSAPLPGGEVYIGNCVVQQVIPSVFGGAWTVTLTNDLKKGPKAVLKDEGGKVRGTADRAHPFDSRVGLKIEGANTLTPRLGQRTQGGDTPFRWTAFPVLVDTCVKDDETASPAPSATTAPATAPTTPATGTGTTTKAGQTSVLPKGGVAAGAEVGTGTDNTVLLAAGAGAASVVAAGLGFVAFRRRTAGDRG
ncbi:hypothetical protein Q5762_10705 [Streptomyces sp. P9(2023)]|uniref:hypothetical protein n=1 Tax=Streptomyces sp. P9(2023) TaxID=3064394 RepID=UPI0028F3F88C|nr:hypothetical protein [Streptomyces sp. P9(2023)]MDT9688821.1 hypothetical protein [Streptomyces sp. P9(2023)]